MSPPLGEAGLTSGLRVGLTGFVWSVVEADRVFFFHPSHPTIQPSSCFVARLSRLTRWRLEAGGQQRERRVAVSQPALCIDSYMGQTISIAL